MTEEKDIYEIVKEDYEKLKEDIANFDNVYWVQNYIKNMDDEKKNKIIIKYGIGKLLVNLKDIAISNCFVMFEALTENMDNDENSIKDLVLSYIISEDIFGE